MGTPNSLVQFDSSQKALPDFAEVMDRSKRRLVTLGAVILGVGFGVLGVWASMAPLKSAALAPGVVKVASERKTIQHLEGGIVKEILVKEGQDVVAGQVLVRLDDINARALRHVAKRIRCLVCRVRASRSRARRTR